MFCIFIFYIIIYLVLLYPVLEILLKKLLTLMQKCTRTQSCGMLYSNILCNNINNNNNNNTNNNNSLLRVQSRVPKGRRFLFSPSCPGARVHSASCKMSTGIFSGVKMVESRASYPISFWFRCCDYVDPCIHSPRGPSWRQEIGASNCLMIIRT